MLLIPDIEREGETRDAAARGKGKFQKNFPASAGVISQPPASGGSGLHLNLKTANKRNEMARKFWPDRPRLSRAA